LFRVARLQAVSRFDGSAFLAPRSVTALTRTGTTGVFGSLMKRKERYLVRPDEVIVTRQGQSAVIAYKEVGVPTTHLTIGPSITELSDAQIVELHNEALRAQAALAANYKHIAVEVPLGSPQIRYAKASQQWVPRGDVLRCEIRDDADGQLVVAIDEHELSLEAFGRLLVTHAGWGMRIEIVPEDRLQHRPALEVRDPDRK